MIRILLISLLFSFSFLLNAQEIGIRLGGNNGFGGAAIDGVFNTGLGRIHGNLGFYDGGAGVDALWDFIVQPISGEAFSWYAGAGASTYIGNDFYLGASGEIGLEYRFNTVPIVLGLDWRPTFWIVTDTRFGADSFGLNVRWDFGS